MLGLCMLKYRERFQVSPRREGERREESSAVTLTLGVGQTCIARDVLHEGKKKRTEICPKDKARKSEEDIHIYDRE